MNTMFAMKWVNSFKQKKVRANRLDTVNEQVKKMLQTADQKLILMVRG